MFCCVAVGLWVLKIIYIIGGVLYMENYLTQRVNNTLLNMGMPTLKRSIFYNCPIGLRFEISEPWGDNDKA